MFGVRAPFRNSKVCELGQLDAADHAEQDVLRLDVAVHDSEPMSLGQGKAHRADHPDHLVDRLVALLANDRRECAAIHVLAHLDGHSRRIARAEMAEVMKQLSDLANQVQVLFVTVDPERDTQALLAAYVPNFDARFLGLYGDQAATEKVAKEFKVFYQKVPGKTATSYSVDHTAGSYVFDKEGRIRLFLRHGQGPEPITHDLKILLK